MIVEVDKSHEEKVEDHCRHYEAAWMCHCTSSGTNSCKITRNQKRSGGFSSFLSHLKVMVFSVALCLALLVPLTRASDVVHTKMGKIRGLEEETLTGKVKYFAFKGIRYASAPVKQFRFRVIISPIIFSLSWSFFFMWEKHESRQLKG